MYERTKKHLAGRRRGVFEAAQVVLRQLKRSADAVVVRLAEEDARLYLVDDCELSAQFELFVPKRKAIFICHLNGKKGIGFGFTVVSKTYCDGLRF